MTGRLAEAEQKLVALRERHAGVSAQAARFESDHAQETDELRAQRASLEGALQAARQEQARLREALLAAQSAAAPRRSRAVAQSDALPKADVAVLRESISQLAADVARLAAQSEGPNSPILRLVRDSGAIGSRTDLAERIRRGRSEQVSTQ